MRYLLRPHQSQYYGLSVKCGYLFMIWDHSIVAALTLWNRLAADIRNASSLESLLHLFWKHTSSRLVSKINNDCHSNLSLLFTDLRGLIGSVLDRRSLPPEFESWRGHIWRVFHFRLRIIPRGGRSAHLAYQVHKSGRKTSINQSPS